MHRPRYYLFSLALFTFLTGGNIDAAMRSYRRAMDIVPDSATNGEAPFWVGITLADQGRIGDAIPYLRRAYRQHEDWARMVPRLPDAGLLRSDDLAQRLVAAMTEGQWSLRVAKTGSVAPE